MAQTFLQKIRIQLEGADKASKGAKKVSKGMGDLAKKAMAAGAAYFGSKALIEGIKQSTAAFGVQEQAQRKLIKSTGSAATSLSLLASSFSSSTSSIQGVHQLAQRLRTIYCSVSNLIFISSISVML